MAIFVYPGLGLSVPRRAAPKGFRIQMPQLPQQLGRAGLVTSVMKLPKSKVVSRSEWALGAAVCGAVSAFSLEQTLT